MLKPGSTLPELPTSMAQQAQQVGCWEMWSKWLRFSSLCRSHHLLGTNIPGAALAVDFPTGWLQGWLWSWNMAWPMERIEKKHEQLFIKRYWAQLCTAMYSYIYSYNLGYLGIGWEIGTDDFLWPTAQETARSPGLLPQVNHLQGGSDHRPVRLEAMSWSANGYHDVAWQVIICGMIWGCFFYIYIYIHCR